jgi:hypothetical protein
VIRPSLSGTLPGKVEKRAFFITIAIKIERELRIFIKKEKRKKRGG